jgi:hypothetical protein
MEAWNKISNTTVQRFISENEDEIIYVIKNGYENMYTVVFEDAYDINSIPNYSGSKENVEEKFNIRL